MNSLELTSAVTALANAIACRLTVDETALLASIFTQLGDTLATIAARQDICEKQAKKQ
ncbi:MAG: DUF6774 domain-containing protein [Eubacteriales bacterium]